MAKWDALSQDAFESEGTVPLWRVSIPCGRPLDGFPVFTAPSDCAVEADVIIDFSHPNALEPLLQYAVAAHLPAVIATTGLSQAQTEQIRKISTSVPLFFTANMSLGVNLLMGTCQKGGRRTGRAI